MRFRNRFFWVAALVGLSLDQITKVWIVRTLELTRPPQTIPFWPGVFHFTYVTNTGAAFSWFSDNGEWLRWLSLAVSLGLMALGLWGNLANRWEQVGYGFILGGALGNGIDRMLAGEVVDFLELPWLQFPIFDFGSFEFRLIPFPIFNLADVCINIGIACLLIAALRYPSNDRADSSPRD